jgi:hypothetical protein
MAGAFCSRAFGLLFGQLQTAIHLAAGLWDELFASAALGLQLQQQQQQQFLLQQQSELSQVALALAFEREYVYKGFNVPQQPSYYKTVIRVHWRPSPELLQQFTGENWVPEHERNYNQRWREHFRITYEGFQYIKKAIAADLRAKVRSWRCCS